MKSRFFAACSFSMAALAVVSTSALQAQEINRAGQRFPAMKFSRPSRHTEVLETLKTKLPEVARWYGTTEDDLKARIRRDRSIMADKEGYLAYACKGLIALPTAADTAAANAGTTTGSTTVAAAAPFPAADTFVLHSRPASNRKIFLDFNGHTTTGTRWNTSFTSGAAISTPAYDLDGAPTTFSTTEMERIQRIWQRVAEDYAPFDVDVTTQDPGVEALRRSTTTDQAYGVRVCIGGSSYSWLKEGAGGIAYVGSFNWNTDTPCFVFTTQLGNGNEKYVAEATSHEVGHTLGLNHDGQTNGTEYYEGHGNWAPVMGVGYDKEVTQFSKGEYPSANNTQDDLAVMQTYGAPLRTDDAGDSILNAATLDAATLTAAGTIGRGADADLFKFTTGGGAISFQTTVPSPSSNLDAQLSLYDGAGNLVTSGNPAGLPGALSATVAAGTYYVAVDGVGAGSPLTAYNDYGSLGDYVLSGTASSSSGNQPPVAKIAASVSTGTAPLAVAFSAAASTDADGTIASYDWDFGDGETQNGGTTATHSYPTPGTYVASVVVYDNGGLSSAATATITVSAVSQVVKVSVSDIKMVLARSTRYGYGADAHVFVKNTNGQPVANARVYGRWTGLYTGDMSAVTNSQGEAVILSPWVNRRGTFTFTVTNVTSSAGAYNAAANVKTSASISTP